nr:helix-turn-helix domain-containing protein [Hyphomonas sp. Mor2]
MADSKHPFLPLAVSPADGAKLAGIGRTKLYELLAQNQIPSFKIGSRRLIKISDIEAWLDSALKRGSSK